MADDDVQTVQRLLEMARDVMLGALDGLAGATELGWAPLDEKFESLRARERVTTVMEAAAAQPGPVDEMVALRSALKLVEECSALDLRQAADKTMGFMTMCTQLVIELANERGQTCRDVLLSLPPLPETVTGTTLG